MNHQIFKDYEAVIKDIGFEACGRIVNLDDIQTKNEGKLGLGMECLDRDLWEFEPVLSEIKKLGIHIARIQSGWQKTEKEPGVYDFAWLDNIVDRLYENGIEAFMCLCYGNIIYCDNPEDYPNIRHGGVGHFPIDTEKERCGWINYVENLVKHFANRVKYFEIWNEPDVKSFVHDRESWNRDYLEFVKMTAPVIRKNAPDAMIVSCTASPNKYEMLVDNGLADYCDIHSFHGYNARPEMSLGQLQADMSVIKKKAPKLGLWRGEAGFPSYNDPRSKGALSGRYVSEYMQAKFALRHIVCDMTSENLDKTFYFHAYDFQHFQGVIRYHYGILRHDEPRRKPSYYALQMLAHIFDDKVKVNRDASLSFFGRHNSVAGELDFEKLLLMKFFTFNKNDNTFFAYYCPLEIKDEVFASKVELSMPYVENMKKPVIIDPLTRNIYPVSNGRKFFAPVTDYPMFVADVDAIGNIAEIFGEIKTKEEAAFMGQVYED